MHTILMLIYRDKSPTIQSYLLNNMPNLSAHEGQLFMELSSCKGQCRLLVNPSGAAAHRRPTVFV